PSLDCVVSPSREMKRCRCSLGPSQHRQGECQCGEKRAANSDKSPSPTKCVDERAGEVRKQPLPECSASSDEPHHQPALLREPFTARRKQRGVEHRETESAVDEMSYVEQGQGMEHRHRQ